MEQIFQKKQSIRAQIKAQREQMTTAEVTRLSGRIIENLRSCAAFRQARCVHTYVAWRNEVRTQELIAELLAAGVRVAVPSVDVDRHDLHHFEIKSPADLQPGAFGILEPAPERGLPIELAELQAVIVPAIAVDRAGHRIGYGGGYYDKFLAQISCPKLALVYQFQVVEKIPTRNEDQRVDVIVTEKGVFPTQPRSGQED